MPNTIIAQILLSYIIRTSMGTSSCILEPFTLSDAADHWNGCKHPVSRLGRWNSLHWLCSLRTKSSKQTTTSTSRLRRLYSRRGHSVVSSGKPHAWERLARFRSLRSLDAQVTGLCCARQLRLNKHDDDTEAPSPWQLRRRRSHLPVTMTAFTPLLQCSKARQKPKASAPSERGLDRTIS